MKEWNRKNGWFWFSWSKKKQGIFTYLDYWLYQINETIIFIFLFQSYILCKVVRYVECHLVSCLLPSRVTFSTNLFCTSSNVSSFSDNFYLFSYMYDLTSKVAEVLIPRYCLALTKSIGGKKDFFAFPLRLKVSNFSLNSLY